MNRTPATLLLIALLLAACGPSAAQIQETVQASISQTQTAMPSPTPIPFSAMDLEPLVITTGDLPAGFEASQIRANPGDLTKGAPIPDYFFSQSFAHGSEFGGVVDVLVYEDINQAQSAYEAAVPNMPGSKSDAAVGEKAQVATDFRIIDVATLAFIRCHAVIYIQLQGDSNADDVIAYGTRLDKRLEPIVCR